MEIVTFKLTEERVAKARNIINTIESLTKQLNRVKSKDIGTINIVIGSDTRKQLECNYSLEVEAHMINAFINITEAEIKRLALELGRL